jgi:hypothetical protein
MNCEVVAGIPVAVMAKNPLVDIPPDYHLNNMAKQVDGVRKTTIISRQLHDSYQPMIRLPKQKRIRRASHGYLRWIKLLMNTGSGRPAIAAAGPTLTGWIQNRDHQG